MVNPRREMQSANEVFNPPSFGQSVAPNLGRRDYTSASYQGLGQQRGASDSRGKRGPARRRVQQQRPRATKPIQEEMPKPMYLSKTSSVEQNDPLYKEAFIPEPGTDLQPEPGIIEFTSSAIGITEVIDQNYNSIISRDTNFGRRIPESVFSYYCAVGLWARMLYIHKKNGGSVSFDEEQFVEQVKEINPVYPNMLTMFMNSFGNFTSAGSLDINFKLFARPVPVRDGGCPGWWSRVSAETHVYYEHFPNPAAYAYRVIRDLGDVPGPYFHPPLIEPDANERAEPDMPTENFLGWKAAVTLRQEAIQFISSCNIQGGRAPNFRSSNNGVCLNVALMTSVKEYLERESMPEVSTCLNFSELGTFGQWAWVESAPGVQYEPHSGVIQRHERLIQRSSEKMNAKISNAATAFMLRFRPRVQRKIPEEQQQQVVAGPPPADRQPPPVLSKSARRRAARAERGAQFVPPELDDDERPFEDGEDGFYRDPRNNWCSYAWGDYANVPNDWLDSAEQFWQSGPDAMNMLGFATTIFDQRSRVKTVLRAFEKVGK